MLFLYVLLSMIIILLLYMNFEARLVKVEYVRFTKNKKYLKVVQISDIHINNLMVSQKKIEKVLKTVKPDFVVLTGDYINKSKHVNDFLKLLRLIKGNHTVFACLGNHEYNAYKKDNRGLREFVGLMKATGVNVLEDTSMTFKKNEKLYNIIGLNDFNSRASNIFAAINTINPEASVCIGISHNPDIVYDLPGNKIDYLLTGHFHGGQIWAPFNIEFKLMRNEKLCKAGITRGLHKINGIKLYISRGLGNVCFPFRFFSKPEITVFHIP